MQYIERISTGGESWWWKGKTGFRFQVSRFRFSKTRTFEMEIKLKLTTYPSTGC
jgi:hypothetical protein